jgi:subtilisin family serine protease
VGFTEDCFQRLVSYTTGNGSVIVADIDTGISYNHPDLAASIWTNPAEIPNNGIDDDGDGYVDDVHGINVPRTAEIRWMTTAHTRRGPWPPGQ